MGKLIDRAGTVFWIACLGAVVLFIFFAVLGGFEPGDVFWLSAAVLVLAVAFTIHAIRVGRALRGPRSDEAHRDLNALRERRGF